MSDTPTTTEPDATAEDLDGLAAMAASDRRGKDGAQPDPDPDAVPAEEVTELGGHGLDGVPAAGIDLLADVDLDVTIELGRTEMLVEDVLRLGQGSVVELDKLAGDPVDVYVNGRLVARGEVLVLNDNFCIRISEIVADLEEQALAAHQDAAA